MHELIVYEQVYAELCELRQKHAQAINRLEAYENVFNLLKLTERTGLNSTSRMDPLDQLRQIIERKRNEAVVQEKKAYQDKQREEFQKQQDMDPRQSLTNW